MSFLKESNNLKLTILKLICERRLETVSTTKLQMIKDILDHEATKVEKNLGDAMELLDKIHESGTVYGDTDLYYEVMRFLGCDVETPTEDFDENK
jgi:hypothetical protein